MPVARLTDRRVVSVTGEDAATLLQGLVTCNVERLQPGEASAGALLTPQGKILFDFIVVRAPDACGGGFLFDVAAASAADLAKRLNFYKLRAKVVVSDRSEDLVVAASWQDDGAPLSGLVYTDPRLADLGQRVIAPVADFALAHDAGALAWRHHRIWLAVPEGGDDFAFGEIFPHEADLDQIGAVDFNKGCYVGQEVVSRMHHRGAARTRMLAAQFPTNAVANAGDDIMAGEKRIGDIRSRSGDSAIAMVRLDKLADALEAGQAPSVNGVPVSLLKPVWAQFDLVGK